eukprot:m.105937 g.105937  ORF g.105937 m.105937 type:complete len:237 (+) comp13290_c0_seq6:2228-2938(+)
MELSLLKALCSTVDMCRSTAQRQKKVVFDVVPLQPLRHPIYHCSDTFDTSPLSASLKEDQAVGIIVVDGQGCLFATIQGNTKRVLHRFSVSLPSKHRRGGQSAPRFARIRQEKKHNYIRKVCEEANRLYLEKEAVTVTGFIFSGSASLKTEVAVSPLLDQRIRAAVLTTVDVAYGGMSGLSETLIQAEAHLCNLQVSRERRVLNAFFDEIARDTNLYSFGAAETMSALDQGSCQSS